MKKIRVLFMCHEWTLAGTARSHLRILEALDRSQFEPYALYWPEGQNDLLPRLQEMLGPNLIPFSRSLEKTGPDEGYKPLVTDFDEVVASIAPDILHHARGGYYEWPLSTGRHALLQVETNIFGDKDDSLTLDKTISICHYIAERRGKTDAVVYNPIPIPPADWQNLREELGIPEDAIVCGRIGRPANFTPIAIEAFSRVVRRHPNMYYLIVAPCREMVRWVKDNQVSNVLFFMSTVDDEWIHKFHRTLDIFLHYRQDGEVMSTAIAQAMQYGIPVLSHTSPIFNGQIETVDSGGLVCQSSEDYANTLEQWVTNKDKRESKGVVAQYIAHERYSQSRVVRQIEKHYKEWLK